MKVKIDGCVDSVETRNALQKRDDWDDIGHYCVRHWLAQETIISMTEKEFKEFYKKLLKLVSTTKVVTVDETEDADWPVVTTGYLEIEVFVPMLSDATIGIRISDYEDIDY